jgi:hypothetical protein
LGGPSSSTKLSNQESVYYQARQLILPRVDGPTSNAYIRRPPGVTGRASRRVKQCRTGTAPTGKWLHMMGKRGTDKCAKCKTKPDTVHNTLSGCPCMMGIYTLRHNKLCGAGYKFIGNGKLGAAVISQDIGRHNAADIPEEQAKVGTRIGGRIWTPRKLTDAERKKLHRFRPDIYIQHEMTNFHIVELKCPRPAAPECHRPAPR